MRTDGGRLAVRIAATTLRVARIRGSSARGLWAAVQRLAAIDSPARLITAAAPSISDVHGPPDPSGFQSAARVFAADKLPRPRVSTTTSCPSADNAWTRGRPRKPVPPATTIFIRDPRSSPNTGGEVIIPASDEPVEGPPADAHGLRVDPPPAAARRRRNRQVGSGDRVAKADAQSPFLVEVVPQPRLGFEDRDEARFGIDRSAAG